MLSYLRDPNLEELPADQQAENTQKNEQEYLTVATHSKDVKRSTTILGVLFIIGLICLGIMIKKSEPKAAVASNKVDTEELQMEKAITSITGIKNDMLKRMDEIVQKFNEFSSVFQIEVNQLVKNPFQLETLIPPTSIKPGDPQIDTEMIWQEQVRQKAKKLKLYSTMQSEKGVCCMIENEILYVGDEIEGLKVTKISNDNVQLQMDNIEITLNISK